MDRDFIYRSTLVWLEIEQDAIHLGAMSRGAFARPRHEALAESLTNHLVNNWLQIQQATDFQNKLLRRIEDHPLVEGHTIRDAPNPLQADSQ